MFKSEKGEETLCGLANPAKPACQSIPSRTVRAQPCVGQPSRPLLAYTALTRTRAHRTMGDPASRSRLGPCRLHETPKDFASSSLSLTDERVPRVIASHVLCSPRQKSEKGERGDKIMQRARKDSPCPATTLRAKALCQLRKRASSANHARSASLHAPRNAAIGRARNHPLTPQNHREIAAGTTILESCRPHLPRILAKGRGSPPRGSNAPITVCPPLMSSDCKVPSRTLASPILHTPPP
jgi:hypothetical protein